ncbi:response regulator [Erythrobacter sp.]|uniref:response regulator transcription factor n=1 Tax=Erythrobacter sp. TaxID=1042 RepID=UPI0025ECDA34|nr:response regulator [Erythrobacter sp.]
MLNTENQAPNEAEAEAKTEAGTTPRVYVIDDDSGVRKSLHFMLAASGIQAWPFASAADFLDQLPFLTPAPLLVDIRMPEIDGLQLLTILKERGVTWPAVILTAHGDVSVAVQAMKLGAIDFLEKPFAAQAINQAITQAFDVLDQMQHMLSARDQARYGIAQLTARERETMAILMEGVPNKEVAHRLGLSVRTIEMHRGNALAKLNVKSVAEVVALANLAGFTAEMQLNIENLPENSTAEPRT